MAWLGMTGAGKDLAFQGTGEVAVQGTGVEVDGLVGA